MAHNQSIYQSLPLKSGDNVRILEEKRKFDNGKNTFSKDVNTMIKKEGNKILVNGTTRKLKLGELKIKSVADPISDIQEKKADKKAGQVISYLVRNSQ